jgi:hypothetical protein
VPTSRDPTYSTGGDDPAGSSPSYIDGAPSAPRSSPSDRGAPPNRDRTITNVLIVSLVVVIVIAAGAFVAMKLTQGPVPAVIIPPPATSDFPTPIRHVVVITMDDANVYNAETQPFERYLATNFAFASQFYGLSSNPLFDAEGAITGGYGNPVAASVPSLTHAEGESWMAFEESMPQPCSSVTTYDNSTTLPASIVGNGSVHPVYQAADNPFLRLAYQYVGGDAPWYCRAHVVNLDQWDSDLASGSLPNYAYVGLNATSSGYCPNYCPNATAYADSQLRTFLDPFLNSTLFSSSAVIVAYTYDESGVYSNTAQNVYLSVVSPYAHFDFTSGQYATSQNILTTTEWLLGLNQTMNWTETPPLYSLFDFGPTYNVNGEVLETGAGISGATVGGQGYTVMSGPGGEFSIQLPNGTYAFQATLSVWTSSPIPFVVNGSGATIILKMSPDR